MMFQVRKENSLAAATCLVSVWVTFLSSVPAAWANRIDTSNLSWSVHYMIDTSQSVFGQSQSPYPRDNRGLAVSCDGRYLYAGYNNSYNSSGEIRMIDTLVTDYVDATVAVLPGVRGKAIATDDQGRVYLAEGSSIKIYNAALDTPLYTISGLTKTEGLAVIRENGGALALYATDRTNKTLTRWTISEGMGDAVLGANLAGLGGSGQIGVTGASDLRGVEIDGLGRIWMADLGGNTVFRINSDGTGLNSVAVSSPIDLAVDGDQVFVTQYTARELALLDVDSMSLLDSYLPPWLALALDSDGQSGAGALSGIVMGAGSRMFLSNETGQTANEKSTYGRVDGNSGEIEGTFYTDMYSDDNDPIFMLVPEPGTLVLLGIGLFGLLRRRKA